MSEKPHSSNPDGISHISRYDLAPRVASYERNLFHQTRDLLRPYGITFNDAGGLKAQLKDNTTVSTADLHRLHALLLQMNYIRETGKLPPEARENLEQNLERAREYLGKENVYGPVEVRTAFDIDLDPTEIPPITYSDEEFEKAKKLGMMLVLRVSKDNEGNDLTGTRLHEIAQERFTSQDGIALLDTSEYRNETFFTKENPKLEWKLVTREALPNSTEMNYLEQTKLLRDKLKDNGWLTSAEEAECTNEELAELQAILNEHWQQNQQKDVALLLANLLITLNHRRTFVQAFYDTLLVFLASEGHTDRLLGPIAGWEALDDWTATRSSKGELVSFGRFSAVGAIVRDWAPDDKYGFRGSYLSR